MQFNSTRVHQDLPTEQVWSLHWSEKPANSVRFAESAPSCLRVA